MEELEDGVEGRGFDLGASGGGAFLDRKGEMLDLDDLDDISCYFRKSRVLGEEEEGESPVAAHTLSAAIGPMGIKRKRKVEFAFNFPMSSS